MRTGPADLTHIANGSKNYPTFTTCATCTTGIADFAGTVIFVGTPIKLPFVFCGANGGVQKTGAKSMFFKTSLLGINPVRAPAFLNGIPLRCEAAD